MKTLEALQRELVEKMEDLGADLLGFGDVGGLLPASLNDLPTVVSIAVHLSDRTIDEITEAEGPTETYFHHYRTINALLDAIAVKGMLQIQRWGFSSIAIPASQTLAGKQAYFQGRFSHRMAATRAGLGWIGKNSCLITPEFGPRVRLATILTDMPLKTGIPTEVEDCGDCRLCADACPANALTGSFKWTPGIDREMLIDPLLCSRHMKEAYQHIGRGAVCGICFRVCPKGLKNMRSRCREITE